MCNIQAQNGIEGKVNLSGKYSQFYGQKNCLDKYYWDPKNIVHALTNLKESYFAYGKIK